MNEQVFWAANQKAPLTRNEKVALKKECYNKAA